MTDLIVKILLVEDEAMMAKLFERYVLTGIPGTTTEIVSDVPHALKLSADIVLLDLRVPPLQAEDTISLIPEFRCPVIVITAMHEDGLEQKCLKAGAVRFFSKIDIIDHPMKLKNEILAYTKNQQTTL